MPPTLTLTLTRARYGHLTCIDKVEQLAKNLDAHAVLCEPVDVDLRNGLLEYRRLQRLRCIVLAFERSVEGLFALMRGKGGIKVG